MVVSLRGQILEVAFSSPFATNASLFDLTDGGPRVGFYLNPLEILAKRFSGLTGAPLTGLHNGKDYSHQAQHDEQGPLKG